MIQSVRGMNDIFGKDARLHQIVMHEIRQIFAAYQFELLQTPIVEKTELFARGIGTATDIIEKEMYTFLDRNEESLSLRPEGTAGCVRACLEHGLIHNQIRKFWYSGPMFRHERPQKGRYRQFYQVGAEVFGIASPDIEAENLNMLSGLWKTLSIHSQAQLEINSIGTIEERKAYRASLTEYLATHKNALDSDSQRRLDTNPLRILDSKDANTRAILELAPKLNEFLRDESHRHFEQLQVYLKALQIEFIVNPRLVRGLDYYCHTVFEWTTSLLGAQATFCAGGRYDGLVAELGGKATPAFGFALGLERLLLLTEHAGLVRAEPVHPIAYIMTEEGTEKAALTLAKRLREADIRVALNCGGGSFKSQSKRAEQADACVTLMIKLCEAEIMSDNKLIEVRHLRDNKTQYLADDALVAFLKTVQTEHG